MMQDILNEIEFLTTSTGRCQIRGFGTFRIKIQVQKRMHNVQTKKIITIPTKIKMIFLHARDKNIAIETLSHSDLHKLSTTSLDNNLDYEILTNAALKKSST